MAYIGNRSVLPELNNSVDIQAEFVGGKYFDYLFSLFNTNYFSEQKTFSGNIIFEENQSITLPNARNAERPSSPQPGMIRFNSELNYIEGYIPSYGWTQIYTDLDKNQIQNELNILTALYSNVLSRYNTANSNTTALSTSSNLNTTNIRGLTESSVIKLNVPSQTVLGVKTFQDRIVTSFTSTGQALPSGTTDERSGTPQEGVVRYNTTTGAWELYTRNNRIEQNVFDWYGIVTANDVQNSKLRYVWNAFFNLNEVQTKQNVNLNNGSFATDNWYVYKNGPANIQYQLLNSDNSSLVIDSGAGYNNFAPYARFSLTGSGSLSSSNYIGLYFSLNGIIDLTYASGKTFTLGFNARCPTVGASNTNIISLGRRVFGVGASPSVEDIQYVTHTLDGAFRRYTNTFTVPASSTVYTAAHNSITVGFLLEYPFANVGNITRAIDLQSVTLSEGWYDKPIQAEKSQDALLVARSQRWNLPNNYNCFSYLTGGVQQVREINTSSKLASSAAAYNTIYVQYSYNTVNPITIYPNDYGAVVVASPVNTADPLMQFLVEFSQNQQTGTNYTPSFFARHPSFA